MREQGPVSSHNLFRRKDTPDLYCVVPESRPVPEFIRTPAWEFAGTVDHSRPLAGYRVRAARVAFQHQGFYAFERFHPVG
jgi:hypothetical protein